MELSWINGMLGKFGEQHQRRQRYLNLVGEQKIRTDASGRAARNQGALT
jgi:hypothetical protein